VAKSGLQPFILEPVPAPKADKKDKKDKKKDVGACSLIDSAHPFLMNQVLVISIDLTALKNLEDDRFKILNLNITNQQGTSLNPTPIRPSLAAGTATGPTGGSKGKPPQNPPQPKIPEKVYLTWSNLLTGDTIPTVSVNLVYTPVAPALPFRGKTFYPAGSIVISDADSKTNGHYYVARNSGVSSSAPDFDSSLVKVPSFKDGSGLVWRDEGLVSKVLATPPAWQAKTAYLPGAQVVTNPSNNHYYQAKAPGGKSGDTAPPFQVNGTDTPDSGVTWQDMGLVAVYPTPPVWTANVAYAKNAQVTPSPTNGHYYQALSAGVSGPVSPPFPVDGTDVTESDGIVWVDQGSTLPTGAKPKAWAKNTPYIVGDVIQDPSTGHYYSAFQPGISGNKQPDFHVPTPQIVTGDPIAWEDLGTTVPASLTVGVPGSDQTVNLLTYTFPQSHTLSYFNLTSGVVFSTIKNRTFANTIAGSTSAPPVYAAISSGRTIDPILAVTAYVFGKPMDAERPWHPSDLKPGLTLGISLPNPTSNYYVGLSSELFIRNLQLFYGASINVGTALNNTQLLGETSPATHQHVYFGGVVGLTFNISGFIQSLIP